MSEPTIGAQASAAATNEGNNTHETLVLILRELRSQNQTGATDRIKVMPSIPDLDMNVYASEPHPIDGICLVLRLTETRWSMQVYAPGVVPNPVSRGGVISTYFSRPHGSAGIAIDTFIREGRGWKHKLPEMVRAEKAYAAPSGSAVI